MNLRKKFTVHENFDETGFLGKFPMRVLFPFILMAFLFIISVFLVDLVPRSLFIFVRASVKAGFFLTAISVIYFLMFQLKKTLMFKLLAAASALSAFAYLYYKFLR